MSISQLLLNEGAHSSILNPPNAGQGSVNGFLAKGVRFLGRATWALGSCSIGAVCGVAYHGFKLIDACLVKENIDAHVRYFRKDLGRLICTATIITGLFFAAVYFNQSRVMAAALREAVRQDLVCSKISEIQIQEAVNLLKSTGFFALGATPFYCHLMHDASTFAVIPDNLKSK
jgi:hypothetical protein